MKFKVFFLVLVSVLFVNSVSAQKNSKKITITGTVLDSSGDPIMNAIVMVDGKNTNSMTDSKGAYKVKVSREAERIGVLTFGSGLIEESIGGRTEINLKYGVRAAQQQLKEQDVQTGEAGVNTGYGYTKEKNLATQVNKIDGTDKKYASYRNIYDMITREDTGVKVSGGNIIIHDSKDFFGSVPALLVVDGVYVNDISYISPANVESIEVLKGTAAAMYGSRGYGGVVLIKTKIKN
jgi:TonB-dependent SusC/RagA subfamily outer membrane receptor